MPDRKRTPPHGRGRVVCSDRVVGGLLSAIPGLGSIAVVLGLIFYVFAVIATNLFGADFPAWFGTLGASLYTLFQVMTLESWSMGIVRPVMDVYPLAWLFFIPFIVCTTFTVLNLFIGIIMNSMAEMHAEMEERERERHVTEGGRTTLRDELVLFEEQIEQLKQQAARLRRRAGWEA